jgi:hypothetical protein
VVLLQLLGVSELLLLLSAQPCIAHISLQAAVERAEMSIYDIVS